MKRALLALLFALALLGAVFTLAPRVALAHDFKPGVLALVERADGRFDVAFTRPVDTRSAEQEIEVVYPAPCTREGRALSCGSAGLHGELGFSGLSSGRMQIVVRVAWLDGRSFDAIATAAQPRVVIDAGGATSPWRWVRLGIQHVLSGLDHVAFVVGLFLVVGASRRLVATITAFTAAHSVTLALAALHLVDVPRAPVEAVIAASVTLVALEAMHRRVTLTRSHPWLVAGIFGLAHGFGFAGALGEIGLPRSSLAMALGSFNVGVEIAQLLIVGALLLVARFARLPERRAAQSKTAVSYALGSLGAYWFIGRTVELLQGQ